MNVLPKPMIEEQFEVIDITTRTENEVNEVFVEEPQAEDSNQDQEMSYEQDESAEQSVYNDSEIADAVED